MGYKIYSFIIEVKQNSGGNGDEYTGSRVRVVAPYLRRTADSVAKKGFSLQSGKDKESSHK